MTALLNFLSFSLCLLPEPAAVLFARFVAFVLFSVVRYRRRVLLENIAQVYPEMSHKKKIAFGRAIFLHLARVLLEFLRIPRFRRLGFEQFVRVEGQEDYRAAQAEGKGILALTGHLGSFEVCVAGGNAFAGRTHCVVKSFSPAVDRFVSKIRLDSNVGLIPAKGAMRDVRDALKRQETVVAALDQNATRRIGVFVDFFGKQACTMSYLARIAARTEAPVVPTQCFRDADGKHVLRFHPAIPLERKATHKETVEHMTQVYTKWIESAIREFPEQWFWTHKRWKTQP